LVLSHVCFAIVATELKLLSRVTSATAAFGLRAPQLVRGQIAPLAPAFVLSCFQFRIVRPGSSACC
jgi:hypothetical protein